MKTTTEPERTNGAASGSSDELGANVDKLLREFDRAELGVDGDCAFALLGSDIQSGECVFIKIPNFNKHTSWHQQVSCAKSALKILRDRLGKPELSYFLGAGLVN